MAGNTTAPTPKSPGEIAQGWSTNGSPFSVNECLKFVRSAYGLNSSSTSAYASFKEAQKAGAIHKGDLNPLPNMPVYWSGGRNGFGHVALSAGNGQVWTTDFNGTAWVDDGSIHLVSIADLNKSAPSLHYEGWSEGLGKVPVSAIPGYSTSWLNGVPVTTAPTGSHTSIGLQNPVDAATQAIRDAFSSFLNGIKAIFTTSWFERAAAGLGGILLVLLFVWRVSGAQAVPIPV